MTRPPPIESRHVESFGVPWEDAFGYEQAVELDGTIYVSGQLSHTSDGAFISPAPLDNAGAPSDFSNMEAQMRRTYENAVGFGATLDDVVEETVYVIDMVSGFQAAGKVRKEMYGTARPPVASNIIGVSRLAVPEQLVEVSFRAVRQRRRST